MNEKKTAVKGSHFDDAEKNNFTLERVGGMENLLEVRDVMEALEPTLQHCPFCGAPAVINGIFAYSLPGAVVRCSQCKCSTEMKLSGQKFPSGKNVTLVVAAAQAVHDWNHRTSGDMT